MSNGSWKLVRDIFLVLLAGFMLIHEVLIDEPRELVIGAALLMLGIPVVLRVRENGNGSKK